jgi:hypothetical protein
LQEAFGGLLEHLNFSEIIKLEERHKLTPEEWAAVNEDWTEEEQNKRGAAITAEAELYDSNYDILGQKKQYEIYSFGEQAS